jgi:CHAD domain-containing protein
MAKKYKIKGLKVNLRFEEAAVIINKYRYNIVLKRASQYMEDPSTEHLHDLRIAIRRLRYSLENFKICYSKNEFLIIIEYTKFLQDVIGEVRDMDVLPEKLKNLAEEAKISIPEELYFVIDSKKNKGREKIKEELIKFLKNRTISDFFLAD